MVIESLYGLFPPIPQVNAHNVMFNRPDQDTWSDYTAFIDGLTGERCSFHNLRNRMKDLLTAIGTSHSHGGIGLLPGGESSKQMIGIFSPNSLDYPVVVQALIANTTPFALISSYATEFELKHAIGLSQATHLFVDIKMLPKALRVAKGFGISPDKIMVMNGSAPGHWSVSSLIEEVRQKQLSPRIPQDASSNTLAYLVFSSGTSGLPKAVMISHGNIIASLLQAMRYREECDKITTSPPPDNPEGLSVVLATLPFHHSFGFHVVCLRSGLAPMTCVVLPRWNIQDAIKMIPKYRVSVLTVVPSMAHQLAIHPQVVRGEVDFSSVQSIACGAAYLSPNLSGKLEQIRMSPKGRNLGQGYGLSECTLSATVTGVPGLFGGKQQALNTTGHLLAGMQAKIWRNDGSEADIGEPGELLLRGPNIALGYWNNEKSNKETFLPGGWLKTGDIFKVDPDGNFYYCDREKDTLKISGAQVSPSEIEDVLLAQPDKLIVDVTVAGVPDGEMSNERVPRAWVVLSPEGRKRGEKAVISILDEWHQVNLSKYKWLRGGITTLKEIPKLPTGKVLRRALVDEYASSRKNTTAKL